MCRGDDRAKACTRIFSWHYVLVKASFLKRWHMLCTHVDLSGHPGVALDGVCKRREQNNLKRVCVVSCQCVANGQTALACHPDTCIRHPQTEYNAHGSQHTAHAGLQGVALSKCDAMNGCATSRWSQLGRCAQLTVWPGHACDSPCHTTDINFMHSAAYDDHS